MPELGPLGSVRGDRGNPVPYRDTADDVSKRIQPTSKPGSGLLSREQGVGDGLLAAQTASGMKAA